MSYEKELLEVAIYQCGKLTPNEEDRLYKWIKSAEDAKRKADEYEAKAKAFDEIKVYMQSAEDKLCDEEYFNEDVYEECHGIIETVIDYYSESESGGYDA